MDRIGYFFNKYNKRIRKYFYIFISKCYYKNSSEPFNSGKEIQPMAVKKAKKKAPAKKVAKKKK